MIRQTARSVLMVRPANFAFNAETATDNAFQNTVQHADVQSKALEEFDQMVALLRSEGVEVWVHNDSAQPLKPDAIFPNNWFCLLPNGHLVLFPMMAQNRRLERDTRLIAALQDRFKPTALIDFSAEEQHGRFLEGTGSLVFDHLSKVAYAAGSSRTHEHLAQQCCERIGYSLVWFEATDAQQRPYYHTNVLLSVGSQYALVCTEAIRGAHQRQVLESLAKPVVDPAKPAEARPRRIIEITREQVAAFAGNVLELRNAADERLIVLSATALDALDATQLAQLSQCGLLIPVFIPTIEQVGGGSARCMLAELFEL